MALQPSAKTLFNLPSRFRAIQKAYAAETNAFKLGASRETMRGIFNRFYATKLSTNEVRETLDALVDSGDMTCIKRPGQYTRYFMAGDEPTMDQEDIRKKLEETIEALRDERESLVADIGYASGYLDNAKKRLASMSNTIGGLQDLADSIKPPKPLLPGILVTDLEIGQKGICLGHDDIPHSHEYDGKVMMKDKGGRIVCVDTGDVWSYRLDTISLRVDPCRQVTKR